MRFRIRYADQIVGGFLLLGLAVLIAAVILLGMNQRWFEKSMEFTSRFPSATGLNRGMSINLKGFEIGRVTSVALTEINDVDVTFSIYEEYYSRAREHSVIQLASSPFGLGGGGLVFHPGKGETLMAPGSFVPSYDSREGKQLIAAGLVNIPAGTDAMSNLLASVDLVLGDVPILLGTVNQTLVSLDDLLVSFTSTLTGATTGPVGETVLGVNALLARLDAIAANLELTTRALTEPDALVASLTDRLIQPGSSISRLLDDNLELYRRINGMMDTVQESLDEVQSFSSYLNATRPQIYGLLEETRKALNQGQDVMEGVKNNPLIRGGVTERTGQNAPFGSFRDEDF